jgi:hypothetical protein
VVKLYSNEIHVVTNDKHRHGLRTYPALIPFMGRHICGCVVCLCNLHVLRRLFCCALDIYLLFYLAARIHAIALPFKMIFRPLLPVSQPYVPRYATWRLYAYLAAVSRVLDECGEYGVYEASDRSRVWSHMSGERWSCRRKGDKSLAL